jgi:hypothetical protein
MGLIERVMHRTYKWASARYCQRPMHVRCQRPLVSFSFDDFPHSAVENGARVLEDLGIRATYFVSFGLSGTVLSSGPAFTLEDVEQLLQAEFERFEYLAEASTLLTSSLEYEAVFERVGEFGTMMALGNRSMFILRLIVLESALLGLIGSALGVLIGIGLALGISAIGIPMPPPPNASMGYEALIRVVPQVLLAAAAVGLGAPVLAAVIPAIRVIRVPVAQALRANV